MAMSESEQMDTFFALMESHIDPEFASATNILQFMKDEGIIVFTNLKQIGMEFKALTWSTLNSLKTCLLV